MTTKTATVNELSKQETSWLAAFDEYLAEMGMIRKRMKATDQRIRAANLRNHGLDQRIRRADAAIARSQAETRAILRHVQASR